jgi:hypothetical protein
LPKSSPDIFGDLHSVFPDSAHDIKGPPACGFSVLRATYGQWNSLKLARPRGFEPLTF